MCFTLRTTVGLAQMRDVQELPDECHFVAYTTDTPCGLRIRREMYPYVTLYTANLDDRATAQCEIYVWRLE